MPRRARDSAAFWDEAARENAAWYIATSHTAQSEDFFAQGAAEVDALLAFCGVVVHPSDTLLEIGCGVGRMTRRLAELAGQVIATDVSDEMLTQAARNLESMPNVVLQQVAGDGSLPVEDRSVDVVFSYITLQHVPSADAQLRYLSESLRALRPGGRAAIQLRAPGLRARMYDWAGHVGHLAHGRRTLHPAWRGAVVPTPRLGALAQPDASVQLRQMDHRHVWFIASRTSGPAA